MIAQRWDQARLALMLLTRLPVGRLRDPVPSMAACAWAFPLVGLVVGLVLWAVMALAQRLGLPPTVAALLTIAVGARLTGALHHDGLADLADGLGGGRDRTHALEIMRDSRIGSYGTLALILAVGLQTTALSSLAIAAGPAAFALIAIGSRSGMVVLMRLMPPARLDGLGRAAGEGVQMQAVWPGAGLAVLLAIWLGWAGLVTVLAMALACGWVAWMAWRRLGGQSGDVLGAAQLCAEIAGWVALSAIMV